ncbi:Ig-like domain repeat protein [Pseudobacteroides cellulosolvens]|uniref:Dockerin domain-containing protein n=1 Tax=Pseudobacteroides cellulosolvens ATCC 35603 = DSM 2933 TaxID=398512 RepID=A0A0L6JWZ0_9FIRM|nr:Ig-like domain repeat protein [Pseudobacteroides cellulosolvens]KNY29957.1 hypothetical protein Bccel_5234 [Pseudobacteroides cellulosolvens ATCC 35603 = DSM 2933]
MDDLDIISSEDKLVDLAEETQRTVEEMPFKAWYGRQGCLKQKPANGVFINAYPLVYKASEVNLIERYGFNRTIMRRYDDLSWKITDFSGQELISGNSNMGDDFADLSKMLSESGYCGRIKVVYKSEYEGKVLEDVSYQYWDPFQQELGVFGIVPNINNGIIKFYTEDGMTMEASIINGAFSAKELKNVRGKITASINTYNGQVLYKTFNKNEGDYYLYMAPPVPVDLKVSSENGCINLAWTGEGLQGYNVKRSSIPGGEYVTIAENIIGDKEQVIFTDDISDGTRYYYTVSAVNGGIESLDSPIRTWIEPYATSTVIRQNAGSFEVDSPVAFGVEVTCENGNYPSGSVIIREGDMVIGEEKLQCTNSNMSIANITVYFALDGEHSITAEYIGNEMFQSSKSMDFIVSIEKYSLKLMLSSVPSISVPGQPLVLTAIASGTYSTLPRGTVLFIDGNADKNVILGESKLTPLSTGNKGIAEITVNSLSEGEHYIVLHYVEGEDYLKTFDSVRHLVSNKYIATETTLKSNYNPIAYKEAITLTATVKSTKGQATSGRVVFRDLDEVIGTVDIVPVEGTDYSEAVLKKQINFVGIHHLTAEYQDNDTYAGSVGRLDQLLVSKERNAIELNIGSDTVSGEQVLSADLTWLEKEVFPTGSVVFKDGDNVIGEASFEIIDETKAAASLKIKSLTPGFHTITAIYNGDICFNGSSDSENITVTAPLKKKYKISGWLESGSSKDCSGFSVKIEGNDYFASTNSLGYFELTDVDESDAGYSISITKPGHLKRIISLEKLNGDVQIGNEESKIQIWPGDIDQDGTINMKDVIMIAKLYNVSSKESGYNAGYDLNQDGVINISDIIAIAKHFNASTSSYNNAI